jgi:hypothetical protein
MKVSLEINGEMVDLDLLLRPRYDLDESMRDLFEVQIVSEKSYYVIFPASVEFWVGDNLFRVIEHTVSDQPCFAGYCLPIQFLSPRRTRRLISDYTFGGLLAQKLRGCPLKG